MQALTEKRVMGLVSRLAGVSALDQVPCLMQLGGKDKDLHRKVLTLLSSDWSQSGEIGSSGSHDLEMPKRIGAFRIVDVLGRGGMGTVYLAEQEDPVQRFVALKVLKKGMDTEDIVNRFQVERQILADLNHPFITRLFDAGQTEDGRPFFVMEYVEGRPIHRYCDALRLNVGQRLALFRKVCKAVAFAHGNLVVHRDLKPDNILITDNGEPKLLDFGIAKLLDPRPDGQQRTYCPMMTPEYAAPEQVRGDTVTTSADVYSLGVLLYELLTGHAPYAFKSRTPAEIRRRVCGQNPLFPSRVVRDSKVVELNDSGLLVLTQEEISACRDADPGKLRRLLKGELDSVIMKALAKEVFERYEGVAQLIEDLDAYRSGFPVRAHRRSWLYQGGKFLARNRVAVSLSAAGLLLTSASIGKYVDHQRDLRISQAEQLAVSQRADAVARFLTLVVEDANEQEIQALVGEMRQAMGDRFPVLAGSCDLLAEQFAGNDQIDPADLSMGMGMLHLAAEQLADSGRFHHAERLYRGALEFQVSRGSQNREQIEHAVRRVADFMRNQDRDDEVLDLYRRFLDDKRAVAQSPHFDLNAPAPPTSKIPAREQGWDQDRNRDTAVGVVITAQQGPETPVVNSSPEAQRPVRGTSTGPRGGREGQDSNTNNISTLDILENEGRALEQQGFFDEALAVYQKHTLLRINESGDTHPKTADAKDNLARVYRKQARLLDAENTTREALTIRRTFFGEDHVGVALTMEDLAEVLENMDRWEEASLYSLQALDIRKALLGEDHPQVLVTYQRVAQTMWERGLLDEAFAMYTEILEMRLQQNGRVHPDTVLMMERLADIQMARGMEAEVELLLHDALDIRTAIHGSSHPALIPGLRRLVEFLIARNREEEALFYQEMIDSIREISFHSGTQQFTDDENPRQDEEDEQPVDGGDPVPDRGNDGRSNNVRNF